MGVDVADEAPLESKVLDAFSCRTTKRFYDGKVHEIVFTLTDLDHHDKTALYVEHSGEKAIETTPKTSHLAALGKNTSLGIHGGKLTLRGDYPGHYAPSLVGGTR